MIPSREIYWNISGYGYQYLFLLISVTIFGYGIWRRWKTWQQGKPENRFNQFRHRLSTALREIFLHKRIFRFPYTGFFHYTVLIGFLILFLGTTAIFIEADLGIDLLYGNFYLYFQSLILDISGGIVLSGITMALFQRYIRKPARYHSMPSGFLALAGLLILLISGFLVEGIRISATNDLWGKWSPIGYLVSLLFKEINIETQKTFHQFFWWFHLTVAFFLLAYLPFSKLRHIILGPLNIYFRRLDAKGLTVDPIDLDTAEKLGVETITDFSWKHLLDLDACTECGRCQEVCPVYLSEQPFSPRNVILDLRDSLNRSMKPKDNSDDESGVDPLVENSAENEMIWFCRTCRACMEECPVFIEHIPKFIEQRRFEVMEKADFPQTLQNPIESLESRGHPYRGTSFSRTDWLKKADIPVIDETSEVELLYWVGCTTALNEDNWEIAKSLSGLLKKANVNFAVLGDTEMCCGEPARRIGNEYLFENIVRENIEMLKNYRFKALITSCPHCFNAIGHEYKEFGGTFNIYHHSEYLFKLIQDGKLKIQDNLNDKITFHDPCYLGRYNDIYDSPRKLIENAAGKGLTEMKKTKRQSFCCGGGGGGVWLGEEKYPVNNRLNVRRAQQARETGSSILATACPFCMAMMKDGVKSISESNTPKVLDIAEILASTYKR